MLEIQNISRYGAYGIVVENSKLLLTLKKSGPYKGLWDLPGGGIEFGESPEESLKRELLEETGLDLKVFELFSIVTFVGEYDVFKFHHIGILYLVKSFDFKNDLSPEEVSLWAPLNQIAKEELTPFARYGYESSYSK